MEIDRKMASYLLEIKRRLSRAQQTEFKLTAPNIEQIVRDIQNSSDDEVIKTLASAFLLEAGLKRVGHSSPKPAAKFHQIESHNPHQTEVFEEAKSDSLSTKTDISSEQDPAKESPAEDESEFADFLELKDFPNLSRFEGFEKFLKPGALVEARAIELRTAENELRDLEEPITVLAPNDSKSLRKRRPNLLARVGLSNRSATTIEKQLKLQYHKMVDILTTPLELTMPIRLARKPNDARK